MDDEAFREAMAKLRKLQARTDLIPAVSLAVFGGALWLSGVSLDPQGWAIVGAIGGVGLILFREVRSLHAAIMLARIEAARSRHLGF